MQKGKFTAEEHELFEALEARKSIHQAKLNELQAKLQDDSLTLAAHKAVREEIKLVQPLLVPLAQMQAALASANSRDKYYPDMSKNGFVEFVRKSL